MSHRATDQTSKGLKRKRGNSVPNGHKGSVGVPPANPLPATVERISEDSGESQSSADPFNALIDSDLGDDLSDVEGKYDEWEDWPWLHHLEVSVDSPKKDFIGACSGNVVDRKRIRADFYTEMEAPTHELSELAFGLFDRWGNIKSDYLEHPVKKGSGVWGKELNRGSFFYIENLKVDKDHYRQGFGPTYGERLFIDDRPFEDRQADPCRPERVTYMNAGQTATENFWRSIGFRRIGSSPFFAFTMSGDHPSLALDKSQDYVRPLPLRWPANDRESAYPVDKGVWDADDDATLAILKQRHQALPLDDPVWLATDLHGRNVMHLVALMAKPKALAFLMTLPCATQLASTRDLEGNTPLEWVQTVLNNMRFSQSLGTVTLPMSDEFQGYDADHVACLAQLTNTSTTNCDQMERLRFGCTCGECIAGFISPRTAFALDVQGGLKGDELSDDHWKEWCHIDNYLLCHLPLDIQRKMKGSAAMCNGFAAVFFHFIALLRAKRAPTTANILQQANGERPAFTRAYIDQGGTIAGPILGCFESAIAEDNYLGDGEHLSAFGDEVEQLKECRNDNEFEFVRRQLLRMEGLAVEYPNEGKYCFG